jgi:GNAT superfamily N-acetyltransferase
LDQYIGSISIAMMIRRCDADDFEDIYAVCNDGASAYRGVIAADRWQQPYMPRLELRHEIDHGVTFFGAFDTDGLAGVMGLQEVGDVTLIRHAYVRTNRQRGGIGGALLHHLQTLTNRPTLVGTWKAATWAIVFYQRHGFHLIDGPEREALLRTYWRIPERQIEESVVLRATHTGSSPDLHPDPTRDV